jgi:hypothetical protein
MVRTYRHRRIATAKERTVTPYTQIDEACETAKQELHAGSETPLLASYEQVKMVCHEAIGVDFKTSPINRDGECIQEDFAVGIVLKDVSVIGAPVHDVMPSAGEIDTRSARHGSEASERIVISF